jgi:putative endonuclease
VNDEAISLIDSDNVIFYDEHMGEKIYFVYVMTNLHNTTLYTGITNNLFRRVQEHKQGEGGQFSRRYKMKKLVYFEAYGDVRTAIAREKQIKGGSRMKKAELISTLNPDWLDLTLEVE